MAGIALEQGGGILSLAPAWVPRAFCRPGRRIKLHPDDYYALGTERGGIDERWLSSTINADNGPLTGPLEGLSEIVVADGGRERRLTLRDAIDTCGSDMVGERLWAEFGGWPMYAKFFDNQGPLPFHIHQRDEHVAFENARGKPEAYYFPPQLNNHGGDFPFTFFGLDPATTKEDVRDRLEAFATGDNRITDLSRAYRLRPGTGWNVPEGVLHAPGSLCTYEPQRASDVFAMFESVADGRAVPEDLLWKDSPPERRGDVEHLLSLVDWEANLDPDFARHHFMAPVPMREGSYDERWICYASDAFSAKELTVRPGQSVITRDAACYGLIVVQGHGTVGTWEVESPTLIRLGQMTRDELFVTEAAAKEGVAVKNPSPCEPLVILKHFGPGNPDLAAERPRGAPGLTQRDVRRQSSLKTSSSAGGPASGTRAPSSSAIASCQRAFTSWSAM